MTFLSRRKNSAGYFGLALLLFVIGLATVRWRVNGQGGSAVTVVSAASFDATVAPDSIAAAFGAKLATQTAVAAGDADPDTPGIQLPTTLGGTTVEVNGQRAGLFFVSPGQVNFVIPASTAPGVASVTVRASDGAVSMGTARVEAVAPGVFAADGSGQGAPAAVALRVLASGEQRFEPVARLDLATNKFVPVPIDLGPSGERVFLILYLTGARGAVDADGDGNLNEAMHLLFGGGEIAPAYAGRAGTFVGLDQVNVEIPRGLIGRGAVDLRVNYSTLAQSNAVRIEVAGPPPPARVTGFDPATALVGAEVAINGANFAANANDNQVYFVDEDGKNFPARVTAANPAQIKTIIPFGAGSGPALVRTPQGEVLSAARLTLRTSISGFVETTEKQPLPGVAVRVREQNVNASTDAEGKYILADVPPGLSREVEFDPSSLPLPFPKYVTRLRVRAGRDHHLERVTLRQITGPSLAFTAPGALAAATPDLDPTLAAFVPTARSIQSGGVVFEVADNTTAIFPGGAGAGSVFLNLIENGRTPAKLPPGIFSSTIAQLAPFGVRLMPGGKLTFPNADNLAVNSQPRLYKLDQTPGSPTLGEFIEASAATVSADGQRVETAANAIAETSIYFVAIRRPVTNLIGRVIDSDGATTVRGARVNTRGQEATTDGTGLFVLLNVPFSGANDRLTIEASFQRPGGRVDRAERSGVAPVPNGTTRAPDLVLTSPSTNPNRPPTVIAPPSLSVTEGTPLNYGFLASDPDSNQTIQVAVTGAAFASVNQVSGSSWNLRLAPGAATAGNYTLVVRVTDSQGASATRNIALTVFANRPPVLIVPGGQAANAGQTLSFIVTASDPDLGQTLNFTAQNLPAGATFMPLNANSARFSWTPGSGAIGRSTIAFQVTDNGLNSLSHTGDVTIAVVSQWAQTTGPEGGAINALLPVGGNLLAGTLGGGILLSTNNGASWMASNSGLTRLFVNALAAGGSNVFAGTDGGGVFLSTNNGANWTAVNNGLTNRFVESLAASGSDLFAGTDGGSVFLSTNNGANWTAVSNGLTNRFVRSLAAGGSSVFAGTDGGVFLSTNNGASWTAVNNGLTNLFVRSLLVSGSNVFAGTDDGFFLSTNNGASWTAVNNGLANRFVRSLVMSGSNIFAGTDGGAFLSTNNGTNWTAANNGLTSAFVRSFAVSGGNLFAGTRGGGVFLSGNNGASWSAVNNRLLGGVILSFALSGNNFFTGTLAGGVFLSGDNGASWSAVNNGLMNRSIWALAVKENNLFAGARNGGVFLSTNNGGSWTAVNSGLTPREALSLAVSGSNLFAGTDGGGVFLSTNNGASWTAVNNGLTSRLVWALAAKEGNLFAGTDDGGVFLSTNNGASWSAANNGLTNNRIFALTLSGNNLFAGTFGGGVFRSTDNGASWSAVNSGLTTGDIRSFAVSGNHLFAGTSGGIFLSTNNGANWSAVGNGLTNRFVLSLAVSGNRIFAGTYGSSVFVAQY